MALVGKPCPSIGGLTFIKGDPVAVPSKGSPMAIEFWASWCGPCRMAFPHLSQLQRKYRDKGLRVVGVCLEEDSPQTRQFVARQGSNMDYAVAVDSRGEAGQGLMGAAGVSGIPHAFVIDAKGIVRHHGHPMQPDFEKAVQQVCSEAGPAAGAQQEQQQQPRKELPPITKSREELMALPVKELKQILSDQKISFADLNEKGELVDRILQQCTRVTYYA